LPRERVVLPSPTNCPCCGGKLRKLGETITETLESVPRTSQVIQTVREKFSCRACETITQPPAPFHPIARGRAGANLLADILHGKFCEHKPLNQQSESFTRHGIDLSVSTLADWVGTCTATLAPLVTLIHAHVFRPRASTATTPLFRCWANTGPSPDDYGPMCATIARSGRWQRRRRDRRLILPAPSFTGLNTAKFIIPSHVPHPQHCVYATLRQYRDNSTA
jgi:transposase